MKKKEITQLHSNTLVELGKLVADSESKLAQYKVNRYSKQSKNTRVGRAMRNKIAVMKTIMHLKESKHE